MFSLTTKNGALSSIRPSQSARRNCKSICRFCTVNLTAWNGTLARSFDVNNYLKDVCNVDQILAENVSEQFLNSILLKLFY